MGWGRLKPFWKSKAWQESAEKGTGIFSWGETDLAKGLDAWIPGFGTGLDASLDKLSDWGKSGGATDTSGPSSKTIANTASFASNNQLALYGLIGLVAYKVFFK